MQAQQYVDMPNMFLLVGVGQMGTIPGKKELAVMERGKRKV